MNDITNHNDLGPKDSPVCLMTLDEVRDRLRISRWSVYQLINNRQLKTVQIGSRRLVTPQDFDALIEDLRGPHAPPIPVIQTEAHHGR